MTFHDLLIGARTTRLALLGDDRGEGVISAAIAVLIMAFLGALMWVGFQTIWSDAEEQTGDCVAAIGSDAGDCGNAGG